MTKGLSSYGRAEREKVVIRRLKNKTGGLGYLAALGYLQSVKKKSKK